MGGEKCPKWVACRLQRHPLYNEDVIHCLQDSGPHQQYQAWPNGQQPPKKCMLALLHSKCIINEDKQQCYCAALVILLSVRWQPGWEERFRENAYMYIHGWVPLLPTWNYYNIVNWLALNIKLKVNKKQVLVDVQELLWRIKTMPAPVPAAPSME